MLNQNILCTADYDQFFSTLDKYKKLSSEQKDLIRQYVTFHYAEKGEILLDVNSSCKDIFFINKGLMRAYKILEDGSFFTRRISWENRFITNPLSYVYNEENNECIECLEYTEYLKINKSKLAKLIELDSTLSVLYSEVLLEYNVEAGVTKISSMGISDSVAKYQCFLREYPMLRNRLTNRVLASFLGMSTRTLERAKRSILKE